MKPNGSETFQKTTSVLLCFALLFVNVKPAYADGIDDLKEELQSHYEKVMPIVVKTAQASHKIADRLIGEKVNEARLGVLGSFAFTADTIGSKIEAVKSCFANLQYFSGAISPVITNEPSSGLPEYRRENYTAEDIFAFTELNNQVQRNYNACYSEIESLRGVLSAFLAIQSTEVVLCKEIVKNIHYTSLLDRAPFPFHTRAKLDSSFFMTFPGIYVQVGTNVECLADQQYCDQSQIKANTTQGAQDQESADRDDWARARAASPVIVAGAVTTALSYFGIVTGAAALTGIGAAIIIVLALAIAAYQNNQIKKKVERLNDWIDSKEEELQGLGKKHYITHEEFEGKKPAVCAPLEVELSEQVSGIASAIDAKSRLKDLNWFYAESIRLQTWYNDLFLWISEDDGGGSILDEVVRNKLVKDRASYMDEVYVVRALQEKSALIASISEKQALVALAECRAQTDEDKLKQSMDLAFRVRAFDLACEGAMTLAALESSSIPVKNGRDSVVCSWRGFENNVESLRVGTAADGTANIEMVKPDGTTMLYFQGVSSSTPTSRNLPESALSCSSENGTVFGTDETTSLSPGSYKLSLPPNVVGVSPDVIREVKDSLVGKSRLVRQKIIRCQRMLTGDLSYSIPQEAAACGTHYTD